MMKKILLLFPMLMLFGMAANVHAKIQGNLPPHAKMKNLMKDISLQFVENKGQVTDKAGKSRPDILFTANSGNTALFLSNTGIHYQFTKIIYPEGFNASAANGDMDAITEAAKRTEIQTHQFSLELAGANPDAIIHKELKYNNTFNFYQTNAPDGITGVNTYGKIVYENVYPHIDWVIYSIGKNLKYDFVVHPGGDPSQIKLNIQHAENVSITAAGELLMKTKLGEVSEKAPVSFADGKQVSSRFKQNEDGTIGFDVKTIQGTTLIIDPVVMWATYYGGTEYDIATDCSVDSLGYVFVAGYAASSTAIANTGFQTTFGGSYDGFLAKFDPYGTRIWATYYGGAGDDYAFGCTTDNLGNVFIAGHTYATNLASAGFQNTPFFNLANPYGVILVKFNAVSGTRLWATYYGSTIVGNTTATLLSNGGSPICTDINGNVYLAGVTNASDISSSGFQNTNGGYRDAFLVKFNTAGNRMWATYYGGNEDDYGSGASTDDSGNVYLFGKALSSGLASGGFQNTNVGNTAFLVKFNSSGARMWASYYGGNQGSDARMCVPDSAGNVYLIGQTASTTGISSGGFQNTCGGLNDAFLVKFNNAGARLWATYYGGTGQEIFNDGTIDHAGNLIVCGQTNSTGLANGGFQNTIVGGNDALLVKFGPAGNRIWSSYFGGTGSEAGNGCAVDSLNNIYMVGATASATGITIPGTHQPAYGGVTDGYFVEIGDVNLITGTSITGPVCAGSVVSVPYTISGIYNAINIFTVQLSNASGSFVSPVNIGTFAGTTAGSINATIPLNTPAGTGYRIRVISSSPVIVAPDNGANLVIAGAGSFTNINDTVCSNVLPYVWHGINVTTGGTAVASDTLTNMGGCDSILLLNLVIKPAATPVTINDTICRNGFPFTWNGINVVAPPSGNIATAIYNGIAASTCDSIVTLHLFIRDTSAVTVNKTYCRNLLPVIWNGITIPATANSNPNYATYTTTNAGGCDSIVKLSLTVNESYAVAVYDTACSNDFPFIWNGISVAAPAGNTTTAVFNTLSVHNCDSIVTLHLYKKQASVNIVYVTICSNQLPYLWNSIAVTAGGTAAAVYTTNNTVNCDSIVTLNLTVKNTSTFTQAITICSNQLPYTWNSIVVNAGGNGVATYTTQNAVNCDSIVTLNLTVKNTSSSIQNITICASELPYLWNNIVVASGGNNAAIYTTPNTVSCDSVVTLNLNVISSIVPTINITAFPGSTIPVGTAVTFTATITNGGTSPVLQWKKNGINIGTNSATYTDFNIDSADVITCMLTSSIPCAFPNNIVSNAITMIVITPPPPCLVPVTLISTDIQFSSAIFKWASVSNATGYEVVLDMMPDNPSSGLFTTDTVYHASAMLPGVHYFHIRTRCTNGENSEWITITITIQNDNGSTGTGNINVTDKGLSLYPNPNNGAFNVTGNVAADKANIDIIDKSGRTIYRSESATLNGKLNHRVNIANGLSEGVYLIRVTSGYEMYVIRFAVHD